MTLHPRNRHQGHYDFPLLIKACPALAPFVAPTPYGQLSIDFANPEAVRTLNRALLMHYYGLREWDIPAGYLCPPIPGRADYVHTVADILSKSNQGTIPKGSSVRGLDIGVGSSCIYPIIGQGEYGWHFVGVDVDAAAIASANRIVKANPSLTSAVELRTQTSMPHFFRGIIKPDERFDFTICNPPFHASAEEAAAGSQRKWKNLGRSPKGPRDKRATPQLNFGGHGGELWCPGGEVEFVRRMIGESREFSENVLWFTSLVSKEANLPAIKDALLKSKTMYSQVFPMGQGQKKSRLVAWTFLNLAKQKEWPGTSIAPR